MPQGSLGILFVIPTVMTPKTKKGANRKIAERRQKPSKVPKTPKLPKHNSASAPVRRLAVSTGEAARYCLVTKDTITNWITAGRLRAQRTVGGQFRIWVTDLRSFMRAHGMRTDYLDEDVSYSPACWEYWNSALRDGQGKPSGTCVNCPVFLSGAKVCREIRPLLPGGTLRAMSCADCDYISTCGGCPQEEG